MDVITDASDGIGKPVQAMSDSSKVFMQTGSPHRTDEGAAFLCAENDVIL